MFKCNRCAWYGDDYSAGIINKCFNEELTEEEHDKYRNKGEGDCPFFVEVFEKHTEEWEDKI